MHGPYRGDVAAERLEAACREGRAVLELAPQHVTLTVGEELELSIDRTTLTVARRGRRRVKVRRREIRQLVVARSWPTRELGLWRALRPGVFERVLGLSSLSVLDASGLASLRELERLGVRLAEAVRPHAGGVARATEFGLGQHRVLVLDYGTKLVVYARPVFRERPRRVLEIEKDGSLLQLWRGRERRAQVSSSYGVLLSGDWIRFCDPEGRDLARLFLPWISPQDRAEITRCFQKLVGAGEQPAPRRPSWLRWREA